MARMVIEYDAQNATAKKIIDFILSLGFIKKVPKTELEKAIEEAENGKVTRCTSFADYKEKIQ